MVSAFHALFFSSNVYDHGSGGTAIEQDSYVSPCKDVKLIAYLAPEIFIYFQFLPPWYWLRCCRPFHSNMKTHIFHLLKCQVIGLTVPEIFTNLFAKDTWRKSSSSKTSWSIRKLIILLLVETHIFRPTKIFNWSLTWFRNYGLSKFCCQIVTQ
jgi:hypothetical protein